MSASMLDIYLSTINNRMNESMKILTLFASIFIPLTFIAGVYGMNFKFMPELDWQYGYPIVLVTMVFLAILMLYFFKRKKLF
jgi:magnesium transporter